METKNCYVLNSNGKKIFNGLGFLGVNLDSSPRDWKIPRVGFANRGQKMSYCPWGKRAFYTSGIRPRFSYSMRKGLVTPKAIDSNIL